MYRASEFKKATYKAGEVAGILGVTVKTIQNYDREGRLRVHRTPTNRRVIMRDDLLAYLDAQGVLVRDDCNRHDVVYARVDPGMEDAAANLDAQALSAMQAADELRQPIVLKDIGSGMDDSRPGYRQLLQMVKAGDVRRVYAVSEDVLSESGFHTLKTMFLGYGTSIVVPGRG